MSVLDIAEMIGDRYDLEGFEVFQYVQLSEEMELFLAMGQPFEEAYRSALATTQIV